MEQIRYEFLDEKLSRLKWAAWADEKVRLREEDVKRAKKFAKDAKVYAEQYRAFLTDSEKSRRELQESGKNASYIKILEESCMGMKKLVEAYEERARRKEKDIAFAKQRVERAKILAETYRKALDDRESLSKK